jgi:triosephosphate isomerase
MILVNFKIYKQSFGSGAIELAKIGKRVMEETKVEIVPVVSALDAVRVIREIGVKVMLQSVDEYFEGAKTGYISPIQAKELGIRGALINHSEHKIKPGTIKKMLKKWPEGFESIVCVQTLGQSEAWAKKIKATMVAYEPSYLIGSEDKSVSSEKPEVIRKMVEKYVPIKVIVGAGIKKATDVKTALEMGAKGVLVASSVVEDKDPYGRLLELAKAF